MDEQHHFIVEPAHAGQRLDAYLAAAIAGVSRNRIRRLIKEGLILVDDTFAKSAYRLKGGERLAVTIPAVRPASIRPEPIDFPVLYEDEHLMVIAKPPGLVVHPACGHWEGTLVHGLLYLGSSLSRTGEKLRPGIVHRLDKDTSGIMVVARNDHAHQKLVDMFRDRQVKKIYHAIVHGCPEKAEGVIALAIGRHAVNRKKMAVRQRQGKPAVTRWKLVEKLERGFSFLELRPETGRTHQLRVHLATMGCPMAGDTMYGRKNFDYGSLPVRRQLLHASTLVFRHPVDGSKMQLTATLWPDMAEVLRYLRIQHQ